MNSSDSRPTVGPLCPAGVMLAACLMVFLSISARAQLVTQTFALRSGWNAIWLDVEPADPAVSAVMAGAPLVSLWTFASRDTAVDFIEDLNEPVWNRARWLVHVPTNRIESFQNSLFTLPAKRAYLVHLTNAFTFQVTGRPVWRNRPWAPDAYTLRGFPVDPAQPPDFNTFFRPSKAHFDGTTGRLQKIYRLNRLGQWSLVSASELVAYGEAYWVFTQGGSDYVAPVSVKLDAGESLDFGSTVSAVTLEFANRSGAPTLITVRDVASASPLSYQRFLPESGLQWRPLSGVLTHPVDVSGAPRLRLAMRRGDLATAQYGSVLEIKDGVGTRIQLGVSAARLTTAGLTPAGALGAGARPEDPEGLWVGTASIQGVNEVNSTRDALSALPTSSSFNLRLLLHVDSAGVTRLLKEVVQLWRNGTTTNDANGQPVVERPGRFVLVTDESLFPQLQGATLLDGTPAGRRISTVGFDFETTAGNNFLLLNGSFGGNNTLSGLISLPPQFPTNPYRHKFHPDHDNLDERFGSFRAEAYALERQISLQFSNAPPPGVSAADYGYQVQAGIYRETVTGLNKNPILCQGTFRLTRVSEVGVLNE